MRTELLRFNGAVERDPAIDAWMKEHAGELGAIAPQTSMILLVGHWQSRTISGKKANGE